MQELRKRFDRWCLKNRNKGIRNLMLVIAIGNLITYFLSSIDPSRVVYSFLCFSRSAILRGQIWRLFTYVFTYLLDARGISFLLAAVSLFCYYQFGKILEQIWGSFRFNLYYLTGILLNDIFSLIFGWSCTATDLNLSLFLAVATIAPEAQVLLFFILPIKMKWMAWVYLGFTVFNVLQLFSYGPLYFLWLAPIVPLLNYILFFGKDIRNVLPDFLRTKPRRSSQSRPNANWASSYQQKNAKPAYRHKCTVCGRTDTQYPNLEFRYCSKCSGFYCYCIDHINNHEHIQ
ncbi:MAG: rhomboid family intramembrane serine protease [Clostridia bacterium]|nr:rhomboid family intramembrane serine protease [Clostridia bacterium]